MSLSRFKVWVPSLASYPSCAINGDLPMPLWYLAFLAYWTNCNPEAQLVVLLSTCQQASMFSMSLLQRSTLPCDWLCLALPLIIWQSGHNLSKEWMTWFTNSRPLSECKRRGEPKWQNMLIRFSAMTSACLLLSGLSIVNFVRWSCKEIWENIRNLKWYKKNMNT